MNGVRLSAFLFEFRRVSRKFQKSLGGVRGARQATHVRRHTLARPIAMFSCVMWCWLCLVGIFISIYKHLHVPTWQKLYELAI